MKIGNLNIKHPTVLSPLAGLTDIAFRKFIDESEGCGYMISELVSVEGLIRNNKNTDELIRCFDSKTPQFIQLFGYNHESFAESTKYVSSETSFNGIDINMGCPARKVTRKGGGSALLNDYRAIRDVIRAVRKNTELPVTVKIRLGYNEINIEETSDIILSEGVDALAVHFRTRENKYCDQADWSFAEMLRTKADVPLIGNGDIFDYKSAKECLKLTDGIMIGRGAVENPFIFSEISMNKEYDTELKKEKFKRFTELIEEYYSEEFRLNRIKAYAKYLISKSGSSKKRRKLIYETKDYNIAKDILLEALNAS